MGFVFRFFLQDCYFRTFGEHFFTTLARSKPSVSKTLVKLNYGDRAWNTYPISKCADGRELLFIHIPKCGGTSVAHALGWPYNRHLSTSAFLFSDPERFAKAEFFAVFRNPLERLGSNLMHMENKGRSKQIDNREEKLFAELGITSENLPQQIRKLLTDRSYQKIYQGTNGGRSGFSVMQSDYVTQHGKLLVPNLFTLDRMDLVGEWLTEQVGKPIEIPRKNASRQRSPLEEDKELEAIARERLAPDYAVYDFVRKHGAVHAGTDEARELAEIVAKTPRPSKLR